MKKLFELFGKNKRNEEIKLIFEVGDNLVNFIKYYEKSKRSFVLTFGYNTSYPLRYTNNSGKFGIIYQIEGHSVDKGLNYTSYHGETKLDIFVKPTENMIICEIFEDGHKVKELYINKESYIKLNKIINKLKIKPKSSLNIPSFIK